MRNATLSMAAIYAMAIWFASEAWSQESVALDPLTPYKATITALERATNEPDAWEAAKLKVVESYYSELKQKHFETAALLQETIACSLDTVAFPVYFSPKLRRGIANDCRLAGKLDAERQDQFIAAATAIGFLEMQSKEVEGCSEGLRQSEIAKTHFLTSIGDKAAYYSIATTLHAIFLFQESGQIEAKEAYGEAIALMSEVDPDSRLLCSLYAARGDCERFHGDSKSALDQYKKALAIANQVAPNSLEVARYSGKMGEAYRTLKQWDQANNYFQDCRSCLSRANLENDTNYLKLLLAQSEALINLKMYREAEPLLRKANQKVKQGVEISRDHHLLLLKHLITTKVELEKLEEAQDYLEQQKQLLKSQ